MTAERSPLDFSEDPAAPGRANRRESFPLTIKVALFGASFNPPHMGHVEIVDYLLRQPGFDQVWVIPCWRHPLGKPLVPFWDRFRMTQLAMRPFGSRVRVLDVERRLGGVSYTWRTIRFLKRSHPASEFAWVIGGDQERKSWRHWDLIEKAVELVEIPRGPKSPVKDVSSSELRERLSKGAGIPSEIPAQVSAYIKRKRLFSS